MRKTPPRIITAVAIIFFAGWFYLLIRHINGARIVGRATAPDGTQMLIVQKCNWNPERFTTKFYIGRTNGTWGAFYFDHQDDYWQQSACEIRTNEGCAIFYRGGSPAITYWWTNESYKLHRLNRTVMGAQWEMRLVER